MDTDDLSTEAYNGILVEAEKFTHDLTLHYGLISYECKDETAYLDKAKQLTKGLMEADEIDLEDLFFGNPPEKSALNGVLKKILDNIDEINKIPTEKRHYDF